MNTDDMPQPWTGSADLTPPSPVEKMSKHDLQRWSEVVSRAIRRHEYLLSDSGQLMIRSSTQQSICRLQAGLRDFDLWIETMASASLTKLQKLSARTQAEIDRRTAPVAKPREKSSTGLSAKRQSLIAELVADEDIRSAIVAKHGSVEKYVASLQTSL